MSKNFTQQTAIPARTLTDVLSPVIQEDCMVDAITLTNNDTSDRTVTIKDAAGRAFEKAFTVPAGTRQTLDLPTEGVFFGGGVQMLASLTAVVDMWIQARTAN